VHRPAPVCPLHLPGAITTTLQGGQLVEVGDGAGMTRFPAELYTRVALSEA